MTEYRDGDVVLVRGTVDASGGTLEVLFENGASVSLNDVQVEKVTEYTLQVEDRVRVKGQAPETVSIVKAIITNILEPQVVYMIDGEWVLRTARVEEVTRI